MSLLSDTRMFLGFGAAPSADDNARVTSGTVFAGGTGGGSLVALEPGLVPTTPGGITAASPFGSAGPPPVVPQFPGGRISWESAYQIMGAGTFILLPPDESIEAWRTLDLNAKTLRNMSATRLLRVLADASPDVSRALWDFLRLCNPSWEAKAYRVGSLEQHKHGQKIIDAFMDRLADKYGSPDVVMGKMHFSAFLWGMILVELVLDEDGRSAVDLVTPDPSTVRWEQRIDPVFGPQWVLGQYQGGRFVEIGFWPTVRYAAIDPAPGQAPYGRAPAAPALFSSLFLLGMLQDLRRVIAQQGYPRYDLAINLQRLRDEMSASLDATQPGAFRTWVNRTISEVQTAYNNLEPDSAFIHTDVVTVNRPTGAVSTDVLSSVDALIKELERQLVRALKTMPLLMASGEGTSEANANRQWEIFARGISSVQSLTSSIWSRLLTLACQAEGVAVKVEFQFGTPRSSEEYRDAQTEAQQIQNAMNKFWMGWISQEEAALEVTGHPPDLPNPREQPISEEVYVPAAPGPAPTVKPSPSEPKTPSSGVVTPGGGSAPDNPEVADAKQHDEHRYVHVWVRDPRGGRLRRMLRTAVRTGGHAA
jgi:hypothetical protein